MKLIGSISPIITGVILGLLGTHFEIPLFQLLGISLIGYVQGIITSKL